MTNRSKSRPTPWQMQDKLVEPQRNTSPYTNGWSRIKRSVPRNNHSENGRPLTMEVCIDTGAAVSVKTTCSSIREGVTSLELQPTPTRLQAYTGEPIQVKGSTVVKVEHYGQDLELPLIVSAGHGPALLGRDWLVALQLDWKSIFTVGNDLTLQKVLSSHKYVFEQRRLDTAA